jgi:hypothetical protein
MPKIIWNDTPLAPGRGSLATVYSSDDSENHKGFSLARDKNGFVVVTKDGEPVPGLEGSFTKYIEAKAAVDHFIAKQSIKDAVTIKAP